MARLIPDPDRLVFVTDFPHSRGGVQRLRFSRPRELLLAWQPDEVLPALARLEQATASGLWAVGYLSYEAAAGLDDKLAQSMGVAADAISNEPLLAFALFDHPDGEPEFALGSQCRPMALPDSQKETAAIPDWTLSENADAHSAAVERIRQSIAAGDFYQMNHTLRTLAQVPPEYPLWHYYEALRQRQQADYCAFLDWGGWQVLSLSPELFFTWNRGTGQISTRPMKGTAPRGATPEEDMAAAKALRSSPKERAENVMIVDLLRNDLGRIAVTGSVQTPKLFDTEPYPTLWQMTSTVQAITRPEIGLQSLMQALFPCGSITGAPKRKAMEAIAKLEGSARGVYCGALGIISPYRATFNVAIRTVFAADGHLRGGVGGGITWSSLAEAEYAEAALKARFLHTPPVPAASPALLETLLLVDGRYALLPLHLERMTASAVALGFRPVSATELQRNLVEFSQSRVPGVWRVRLLRSANGEVQVEGVLLENATPAHLTEWNANGLAPKCWLEPPDSGALSGAVQTVALASSPNAKVDAPWLRHKTTQRAHYERETARHQETWDVLLHDSEGHATECTRGNIVLQTADGRLLTPPATQDLLPGTLREALLQRGGIEEAVIPVQRLLDPFPGDQLWFVNSVRGWVPVTLRAA